MALTAAPFVEDDPWKASALILALSQLLLAIFFLLQTVVACLTLQFIKYFGPGNSCWYATYRPYFNSTSVAGHSPREFKEKGSFRCGHFRPFSRANASSSSQSSLHSSLHKLIRGLEASLGRTVSTQRGCLGRSRSKTHEDESGCNVSENRESVSSRSRSQEWCGPKSMTLVCPNCKAAWTVPRPPVVKDACQVRTHSEAGQEGFHFEGRASSPVCTDEQSGSLGREGLSSKTQEASREFAGCQASHELEANLNCNKAIQHPAQDALNEKFEESTGIVSPSAVQDSEVVSSPLCHDQTGSDISEVEASKLFPDIPEGLRSKLASCFAEVAEQSSVIGISVSLEDYARLIETQADLETERDRANCADMIAGLRNVLQVQRKALCALYEEFEEERNAAETAANEAIGMISRLQEEKASLQMESAHYQRMAEEKAFYDEQAMQLLKEVLYRRERENFVLEKEVKLFKRRFFREVRRATKRRKEFENTPLSLANREPLLLLECSDRISIPEEHQEVSTTNLEIQVAEHKRSISHSAASRENSSEKSLFRTQSTDEQPHKRLKGFKEFLPADESHGYGLPRLSVGLSEIIFSAVGDVNEFEQDCQGSFPRREQVERIEQTPGMPGSCMDEDETTTVLHELMAVEKQFSALGEVDGFEPGNLTQFLENYSRSDAMESASSSASLANDQIIVDSSCCDAARIFSARQECETSRCNEEGPTQLSDGFCNSLGVLECQDACYFGKNSSSNIDVTISCAQSREEAQMCTVHDTTETPPGEESRLCSLHCEENVTSQDNAYPSRKLQCVSSFSHNEITIENSGTSIKNDNQDSSMVLGSDTGHASSSYVDLRHDIVTESWQCQLLGKDCTSEDEKWNCTRKELQGLNIRLHVLQSEGVLEGHLQS